MFDEISEPAQAIVQVAASFDPPAKHERAAAVTAIEALREHGNIGVVRNLQAGASLASLKAVLSHGEFGPFCEQELAISPSYRARLLKLNDVREHLSSAQACLPAPSGSRRSDFLPTKIPDVSSARTAWI
jgi:hypothetical protein